MRLTRHLRLFSYLLAALAVGVFAISAAVDFRRTQRDAEADLATATRLLEENCRAAIITSRLQLARIADLIGGQTPAALIANPAVSSALRRIAEDLPMTSLIWITDHDGWIRTSSRWPVPPPTRVDDRAYFTALRDGTSDYASQLIWGRVNPAPVLVVGRRIPTPDGHFAGSIQMSIKNSYFQDFYRSLDPAPGVIFAIYRDNGELVMRSELPLDQQAFEVPQDLMQHLSKADTGTYYGRSAVDGIERLQAYRRVAGHPLVVVAGMPRQSLFAPWRNRTLRNGGLAAVLLAVILMIAHRLDTTLRREATLRERAEALLADKEMLFQEVHHRVKNNMQIVASFLTMQAMRSNDRTVATAFEEALSRLQSMALVHQILYEGNEAAELAMDAYLKALATSVGKTFGASERGIRIDVVPGQTLLGLNKAVPLALLANEALTNALKHAFPRGRRGTIRAQVSREDDVIRLIVSDDGIGTPPGAHPGLGMSILAALVRQLHGHLQWGKGPGTEMCVIVPAGDETENGGTPRPRRSLSPLDGDYFLR